MKKALFLSHGEFPPFKGGIADYVSTLADSLSGHAKVTVAAPYLKGKYASNLEVVRPRLGKWPFIRFIIGNLHSLFIYLTRKPDHIFVTDQISLSLIRLLLIFKKPSVKIHYFVYGTEILDVSEGNGIVTKSDFEATIEQMDTVISISRYVKQLLDKNFPSLKTPVEIVNPAVSIDFLKIFYKDPESSDILKKYGLERNKYILSVGRLVKRKGHHLITPPPGLKYAIIGIGPEKNNLQKKPGVVLLGEVDDKTKKILLDNCIYYAQPSSSSAEPHQRVEGFGISIIEAFACRKTAVVFNHGGMPEIVRDGANGLVVQEGDDNLFNQTLIRLYNDPYLRQKLENQAYLDFKEKYSRSVFETNLGTALKIKGILLYKPRVAYIVEWFYPVVGGAGKQALLQAVHLKEKYRISVFTRMAGTSRQEKIKSIETLRYGMAGNSKISDYLSGMALFRNMVKKRNDIDLVHIHGNLENNFSFFAILFSKMFGKPVIGKLAIAGEIETHLESGNYSEISRLARNLNPFNWLRRMMARRLDRYIAISRDIEKEIINNIGNRKAVFIPNGVEIPDTDKKAPGSIVTFLTVSRLAAHKGIIKPLLEAWNRGFKNDKRVRLLIAGSGESLASSVENEVYEFVKTNKFDNVELLGKQNDVEKLYDESDIFVLPSENEGLSNALLEAAVNKLVCIVSDVSGNTDIVEDGKSGYVFKSDDTDDLLKNMKKALSSREKWDSFGNEIFGQVKKNYSIENVVGSLDGLYKQSLNTL